MRSRLVVLLVVGWLVAACGSPVALPDRTDPGVREEEIRLAAVLESIDDIWVPKPRQCSARLLGQEGTTSYMWARCEGSNDVLPERPAQSGPLRIDGNQVLQPRDGRFYSEDVRELFPSDLADAIFARDERIFP